MKSKIGVEIHTWGFNNAKIIERIGQHNGNLSEFIPTNLRGLITLQKIDFPATNKELKYVEESENVIHVSEDGGKTFTVTLTWKEVQELEPQTENDLVHANI